MKKRFIYWILLLILAIMADIFMPSIIKSEILKVVLMLFGAGGIILAIILNSIAGRTLKLYGHQIQTKKFSSPDKFVNIGIYSCMRHPGQFGNIILLVSITLLSGKICALFFGGWLAFLGVLFILIVEEREAIIKFGDEYCEYIKKTPPFSLKCLPVFNLFLR